MTTMDSRSKLLLGTIAIILCAKSASGLETPAQERSSTILDNGLTRTLRHIYSHCATHDRDVFWCLKVQGVKLLGRALKVKTINVFDGLSIVQKSHLVNQTHSARSSANDLHLGNMDLEHLSAKSLNTLLSDRFRRFRQSRELEVNLPQLLAFGHRNSQTFMQQMNDLFTGEDQQTGGVGEKGRKKKDSQKYLGPFIAAVLLKAAILKMAYHSIAIVAGKALIVGKIALIISAIIGLKKLMSGDGGEKTTYEIVKHPQVQQSHTYSSSHTGEYEGGHESSGGSYHRSIDDEMMMQDKAYRGWVPANTA